MPHSSQLTERILQAPNPIQMRDEIWKQTRYLIAQKPKTEDYSGTDTEHYLGRQVLPGPAADPSIIGLIDGCENMDNMEAKYGITFIDFKTTEGADVNVVSAPYTVMSNAEADSFEKIIREQREQA